MGDYTIELVQPGEIVTDISDRVRLQGGDAPAPVPTTQAEEGGVGSGELIIDDALGNLSIRGGTSVRMRVPDSESDDDVLYYGGIGRREIVRGPYKTGVSRQIKCSLYDGNSGLSQLIFRPGEELERPAETAGARMTWLMGTIAMSNLTDHRYVDFDDPTPMDKADYTRQQPRQVFDDCAQQSGFDFGVIYAGDTGAYAPFYMAPDSDLLDSPIRLSNILSDIRDDVDGNTFFLDDQASLNIDDDRVASGIFGIGDGIEVFQQRTATAILYARRDKVMDAPNVKTLPVLRARVNRWLSDFDSEEYTANVKVLLPKEKATMVKAQYRIQVRASHWAAEGYDQWTWARVLSATPEQVTDAGFLVALELGFPKVEVPSDTFAILYGSHGPYGGSEVWWESDGDEPMNGAPVRPTLGLVEIWKPGSEPNPRDDTKGFNILGTGSIDATLHITAAGVSLTSHVMTFAIRKNGTVVASVAVPVEGFRYVAPEVTVTVSDLDVEPDDKITATVVTVPPFGVVVPAGSGGAGETFTITGGNLS